MKKSTENLNLMEVEYADVPPKNMLNEELETLIMVSIQVKKCGKDEVFELVNNSIDEEIVS